MKPTPALLLALALAACGPTEHAVPDPSAEGPTPPDTAARDTAPLAPTAEAVRRRLEQAERDAAERNREALEAAEP